ncbi:PilZ domain-containing protein [Aerophototrophica crusticola]|uniref:PilZ domain-containing protein n=1 Tax=Aerophototrophica crusticola TaxID=1709002 RepID=A0A858R6F2_9PROT|nr:PilZ domain-containing protein [Rhodospirillaceae bacterium B3]
MAKGILGWMAGLLGTNRRAFDRQPVRGTVTFAVGGQRHDCRLRDVSPAGAFLEPPLALAVGTKGVLELPDAGIMAEATVVRRTPQGVGIRFQRDDIGAIIAGWTLGQDTSS